MRLPLFYSIACCCLLTLCAHAQEGLEATLDQTRTAPFSDPTNAGSWKLVESMSDDFGDGLDVQNKWRRALYFGPDVDPDRTWNLRGSVAIGYENHFEEENVYPVSIVDAAGNPVNGELVIDTTILPEVNSTPQFSSGWLQSLRGLKYGYFEIKAKTGGPAATSTESATASSAFWLVKKTPLTWAEIDIFEIGGNSTYGPGQDDLSNTNLHYFTYDGDPILSPVQDVATASAVPVGFTHYNDYHVYGLEWTADHLRWYVDGALVRELIANDGKYSLSEPGGSPEEIAYDMPLNLVLGMEVFDAWFGLPDTPSSFHIDYVKVWSKKGDDGNLITNGTMDSLDGWSHFGANRVVEITDENELSVELTQVPENGVPWNVIVRSASFDLTPGSTYNLSFDAWSTTQRPLSAKIGAPTAPFTTYNYSTEMIPKSDASLAPSFRNRVTFNLTFECNPSLGPDDVAAQLEFFLGRDPATASMNGAAWPDADSDASRYLGKVYLDNIELTEIPDPSLPFLIDGDLSEWTQNQTWSDSIGETATGVDFREMRHAAIEDQLLIAITNRHEITALDDTWVIFLDTDQSASTGYLTHGAGADYAIRGRYLYQFTGDDPAVWSFTRRGQIPMAIGTGDNATNIEYALPKAWIGDPLAYFVGVWNSTTNDKMGDLDFGLIDLTVSNSSEYVALQDQLTQAENDNTALQTTNQTFQQENTTLTTTNTALQTSNDSLLQDNANLATTNTALQTSNDSLLQDNTALTNNNTTLQTANDSLLQDNATLTTSNASLQAANATLQQENAALADPTQSPEYIASQEALTQSQAEASSLQEANVELTTENAELQEIVDTVRDTVAPVEQP